MNEDLITKAIVGMERHLAACDKYLTELAKGYRSPEKVNTLLDAAMQQIELCCLDMRVLCEKVRPTSSHPRPTYTAYSCKSICGEVYGMENGWLNIRLNTLLPHCKVMGGTQYIADTITRLLDKYSYVGMELPTFEKAYVAIVEHCPWDVSGTFDQDNKGFKGVINALKGRLFPDDDQFELALGLFTVLDEETCCQIYVLPFDEAGDFHYQMASFML